MVSAVRLTVLGSLNMDISVTVPRLPAPGATVLGGGAAFAPGGKGANQAVAAARLGGSVRMVGCVGDDDFGRALRAALRAEGVDDEGVRTVPGAPTGLAMITVDADGENIITVAPGANHEVGEAEIAAVRNAAGAADAAGGAGRAGAADGAGGAGAVREADAAADVLVISAEVPVSAIRAALAVDGRAPRVLNLAPAPPEAGELIAAGVDWLVVNESEAGAVLGRLVTGLDDAARAATDLARLGARNVVVTAGAAGVAYCGPGEGPGGSASGGTSGTAPGRPSSGTEHTSADPVTVPGFPVRAVDSVGAGDTFVGALAVALAAGVAPLDAVVAAAAAGATAATRPGTQSGMPRPADVFTATGHVWPVPVA